MPKSNKPKCDLVMKGGITSGVAYPAAVSVLHTEYDFASIGGASAGAIAAAVTAAAQYGGNDGFERLQEIRTELQEPGILVRLFQTTKETRPLLNMLLGFQSRKWKITRVLEIVRRLTLRLALPVATMTAAVFALSAWALDHAGVQWSRGDNDKSNEPLLWFLIALLVVATLLSAVVLVVTRLFTAYKVHLPSSFYGMCLGVSERSGAGPALTEWLHQRIQWVGGRRPEREVHGGPRDRPLTFRDLARRGVTAQMMTTDLTLGRPVRLPTRTEGEYLFSVDDFRSLFPDDVVDYLIETCPVAHQAADEAPELRKFPGARLPLLVATRMSLSFPVLLAAVPLWTVDEHGVAALHWFSDGGISSNFPIHFFDAWVPSRPTFGLNLAAPCEHADPRGPLESYVHVYSASPPPPRRVPIASLGGFLSRILDTMQNWRDTMQAELPGFHDRVAHIELLPTEGGMNISMGPEVIGQVDLKGTLAAERLLEAFDFTKHQMRRYETFMGMLQAGLVPSPNDNPRSPRATLYKTWTGGLDQAVANGPPSGADLTRPTTWYPVAAAATGELLASAGGWLGQGLSFVPETSTGRPASMRVTPDV